MKLKKLIPEQLLSEKSLSRVVQHLHEHDCGTITAFRSKEGCGGPDDKEYSHKDNLKRNASLRAKLQAKGYGITAVDGSYIENYKTKDAVEVKENVFFVVDLKNKGTLEKDLRALGQMFDQDSVLFIPKGGKGSVLIGTNKCPNSWPGFGKKMNFNDIKYGRDAEFMTKVAGRPFTFENTFFEQVANVTVFMDTANNLSKWGLTLEARKHWRDIEID